MMRLSGRLVNVLLVIDFDEDDGADESGRRELGSN
jgi:hypothetical protein